MEIYKLEKGVMNFKHSPTCIHKYQKRVERNHVAGIAETLLINFSNYGWFNEPTYGRWQYDHGAEPWEF